MKENYVATNLEQNFTDAEKSTARGNIGAQAQLTAGTNITIDANNVISAAGGVFIATYNSTTYTEISNALAAGNAVILRYGNADIPIASSTATRHAFLQVRRDEHSYSQQADSTRAFVVDSNNTWSMNSTPLSYNIIAGAGLTYDINGDDLTLILSAHFMPDLQLLQAVTVDVDDDTTLNIENGKSYFIRITQSSSPIITLSTTSITTLHSLIAIKNVSATSCSDVKIRFNDETGYQHDVLLSLMESTSEYDFYVDIRKLSNSTVIARVYDMPCMFRQGWMGSPQYQNDTGWIGYTP